MSKDQIVFKLLQDPDFVDGGLQDPDFVDDGRTIGQTDLKSPPVKHWLGTNKKNGVAISVELVTPIYIKISLDSYSTFDVNWLLPVDCH